MINAPGITVNGCEITPEQISTEVQYHPAESLPHARYEAMQALVIRELLVQRAKELELYDGDAIENPDYIIEKLFEQEISIPDANGAVCKSFYDNNKAEFFTSPLFEAAHILYLAMPSDDDARKEAFQKADNALVKIKKNSCCFEDIAKEESACSSAKVGGHLGQVTKGQTTPVFEKALFNMQEGEISSEPLASEFGYHLIKVYKRIEGKQLPFEAVQEWIADDLCRRSWQRAFSQYVQVLAGQADISGFNLKQTDTPLVQ